jgi:hypothetical protein
LTTDKSTGSSPALRRTSFSPEVRLNVGVVPVAGLTSLLIVELLPAPSVVNSAPSGAVNLTL